MSGENQEFDVFIDSLESETEATSNAEGGADKEKLTEEKLESKEGEEEGREASTEEEGESATEDGVVKEGAASEAKENEQGEEKQVYSSEELETLLKSDAEIDTARLSPEGRLLMKSFQRGYDHKFKELSDQRVELAKAREAEREKMMSPKDKLFRDYLRDPIRISADINKEIEALEEVTPDHEDFGKSRKTIAQLNALKDEFREHRQMVVEAQKSKDELAATTLANVIVDIPDWKTKEPKLTEFAQKELGLSLEDIRVMSDPVIMGDRTYRFIKAVNKAYDMRHANNTAEKKLVKKPPKALGRASESGEIKKSGRKPEEMSYEEYKAYRMKQATKQ